MGERGAGPTPGIRPGSHAGDPVEQLFAIAGTLTGVQLDERHREMVKSRMYKRVQALALPSLEAYLAYRDAHQGEENPHLISLLTTHHSYFFREFAHFQFLLDTGLPKLLPRLRSRPDRTLKVWSAACSRGQEVYSLAMFLGLHLPKLSPGQKFSVLGTDVDEESLTIARNGVYRFSDLQKAPLSMLQDHWTRGTGEISEYVKARQSLRASCHFARENILEMPTGAGPTFDVIFCRNVFIYFNQAQIRQIVQNLMRRLNPGGYLFVGISESLSQMKMPLRSAGPSIYQALEAEPAGRAPTPGAAPARASAAAPTAHSEAHPVPTAAPATAAPLRVLCVDDSPTVLTLLRRILTSSEGFEVVGVAHSGREAVAQVAALRPAAMTLDIHMPEMDGIDYLRQHYREGHCPVVMVTSVSRENAELAGQALKFGAADYVEKPAMTQLQERAEELRVKLRCAVHARRQELPRSLAVDEAFQAPLPPYDTGRTLRVVVLQLAQRSVLPALFRELTGTQPPCVVLLDGVREPLRAEVARLLSELCGRPLAYAESVPQALTAGSVTLLDLNTHGETLATVHGRRRCSLLVYGEVSRASAACLGRFRGAQVLLEDLGGGHATSALVAAASDVVLPTSFAYLSAHFLRQP